MPRKLILSMLIFLSAATLAADLYSPDRPLFTTDTKYFHIIFPADSRSAAAHLAGFADAAYDEIATLLNTEKRYRITVIITPDSEEINGSFNNVPYLHITLYQIANDSNWGLGAFTDTLQKVFYHELTHAVSMTLRGPVQNALVSIFGTPLGFSMFTTPGNLIEGVTVSFESRDGFGRATDPLAGATIRQDILEGRMKSFQESAGAFDDFPFSTLFYHYGGYFSQMLQQRYGMEKYAQLWHDLGSGTGIVFALEFKTVYGFTLAEAWDEFRDSMTIRVPVYAEQANLVAPGFLSGLAASDKFLYYADVFRKSVYALDPATGSETRLFRLSTVSRISANETGERLLVSASEPQGELTRLYLGVWEAKSGKFDVLPYKKLRDAAWAGEDKILAIQVDGFDTDLVLAGPDGIKTLLSGNESISYANPVLAPDGNSAYAIVRQNGKATLVRVGLADGSVTRLQLPEEIKHLRYLSSDGTALRMGWDDDKLYRLVELQGDTVRWQTVPPTGGVHGPVGLDGRVYSLAIMSDGIALRAYPEDRSALGFREQAVSWTDASELKSTVSVYDRVSTLSEKGYSGASWLIPRFWYPYANLDIFELSIGAGILSADPAGRFLLSAAAAYDINTELPEWTLSATSQAWAAGITLNAVDSFITKFDSQKSTSSVQRISSAALRISGDQSLKSGSSFSWGAEGGIDAFSSLPVLVGFADAYRLWDTMNAGLLVDGSFNDYLHAMNDPSYRLGIGAKLASRWLYAISPAQNQPLASGIEGGFTAQATPLSLTVSGAFAPFGNFGYGPGGFARTDQVDNFVTDATYPVFTEIASASSGLAARWYAQGEASLRILAVPVRKGFLALYATRLTALGGIRTALSPSMLWHADSALPLDYDYSLFGRLSLTWKVAAGIGNHFPFDSYAEIRYKPESGKYSLGLQFMSGF